jgi:hypothetical protein
MGCDAKMSVVDVLKVCFDYGEVQLDCLQIMLLLARSTYIEWLHRDRCSVCLGRTRRTKEEPRGVSVGWSKV